MENGKWNMVGGIRKMEYGVCKMEDGRWKMVYVLYMECGMRNMHYVICCSLFQCVAVSHESLQCVAVCCSS